MTFPMHFIGLVLVWLSHAREAARYQGAFGVREFVVPGGGWAFRWFTRHGFIAITLSAGIIVYRDELAMGDERTFSHELVHVAQHRELGPLFLPAYGWASLVSFVSGRGWYACNALELEARAKEGPPGRRRPKD